MSNTTSPKTDAQNIAADFRQCGCGCGAQVVKKATFRPGHDARFVSILVEVARKDGFSHESLDEGMKALPTPALKAKFHRAFDNAHDKAVARAEAKTRRGVKSDERTLDGEGWLKVGRWEYPARRWIKASTNEFWMERNEKRDGSGKWLDVSDHGDRFDRAA